MKKYLVIIFMALILGGWSACNVPYSNNNQIIPTLVSQPTAQPAALQVQPQVDPNTNGHPMTEQEVATMFPPAPQSYGKVCQDTPVYRYTRAEQEFYDWTIPAGSSMVPIYEIRGDWVVIYPEKPGVRSNYILKSALC